MRLAVMRRFKRVLPESVWRILSRTKRRVKSFDIVHYLPASLRRRVSTRRESAAMLKRIGSWDVGGSRAILDIIEGQYGHAESRRLRCPVDARGEALPWYTYPAIDFIRQMDVRQWDIFEYGAGYGTLFWQRLAREVVTVEHDQVWLARIREKAGANGTLLLRQGGRDYVTAIAEAGKPFDLIVIDGICRRRCAEQVDRYMRESSVVILDNSDWYPNTAASLRSMGLLQVDFAGIGPVNDYTWTTSMFFASKVCLRPGYGRQPQPGIGSLPQIAPDDEMDPV